MGVRPLVNRMKMTRNSLFLRSGSFLALFGIISQTVATAGIKAPIGEPAPQMVERPNPGPSVGKRTDPPARPRDAKRQPETRGIWGKDKALTHFSRLKDLNLDMKLRRDFASIDLIDFLALQVGGGTPTLPGGGGRVPWEGEVGGFNTSTGGFQTTVPITSWPTRGDMEVDLSLTHNAQGITSWTIFGDQWKSSYDYFLHVGSREVVVEHADGTSVPYEIDANGITTTRAKGFFDLVAKNTSTNKWELKTKDQTIYEFSHFPNVQSGFWALTKITDRFGNFIAVQRHSDGYLTSIIDGADSTRRLDFAYTAPDVTITDPTRGVSWTIDKDSSERLLEVVYPAVPAVSLPKRVFTYNAAGQILTDTDRRGNSITYQYASVGGPLLSMTQPGGAVTSYAFPTADETVVTDPGGSEIRHLYDPQGRLLIDYDADGWWSQIQARNADNLVTAINVKAGYLHQYTFDSMGNLLTHRTPELRLHTYTYNSTNDLITYTNPGGKTWTYTYTPSGALAEIDDPVRTTPVTRVVYNAHGEPIEEYDGENLKTTKSYNSRGDITSVTAPDGAVTTSFYGAGLDFDKNRGNPLRATTPAGVTTSFVYDNWLRITDIYVGDNPSTLTYEGDRTQMEYNAESGVTKVTDGLGKINTVGYDARNQVVSTTNGKGETETLTRDGRGFVTAITNGRGFTRSYEYSGRGEVVAMRMPGNLAPADPTEQFSWDSRGLLVGKTNALTQTVLYSYSDDGNLTTINYPSGTPSTFSYDVRNRRTSMVDVSGTTTWTYNDADEITQIAQPNGVIGYEWRNNGQPFRRTEPGGVTVTTGYDSFGRATTVSRADPSWNDVTTAAYDAFGRLATKTLQSGIREHFGYDALGRMNSVHVRNNAGTVTHRSQTWTYDAAGNMANRTINGVTTTYQYDNANQITRESRTGNVLEYTYDANGNRLTKRVNGSLTQNFSYTSDDRLIANQYGTITYDAAGRPTIYPTAGGNRHFTWDYDDRLIAYTQTMWGSTIQAYDYNGFGARVATRSTNSQVWNDLRNGTDVTSPVVRTTGTGIPPVSYLPGIGERSNGVTSYAHAGLKNYDAQSNPSASLTATRLYDAFGVVNGSTGTFMGKYGHGGPFGYQSDSSGLQLLGHRWYDPETGRFITRDPIKDGRNWYAYCNNNPLVAADPDGRATVLIVAAIAALMLALTTKGKTPAHGADEGETSTAHLGLAEDVATMGIGKAVKMPYKAVKKALKDDDDDDSPPYQPYGRVGSQKTRSGQRQAYWKEKAKHPGAADYHGPANVERMKRGRAPVRNHPERGFQESLELHHVPGYAHGGTFVLEVWPERHAELDPHRHLGSKYRD